MRSYYLDPTKPGSFGGVYGLLKNSKLSRKKVVSWLEKEPVYTLHKPARKNYTRRATKVFGVDKQWQADLVDMQKFRRYNSGFGYLLCDIKKMVIEL